jgi:hypothetical protein
MLLIKSGLKTDYQSKVVQETVDSVTPDSPTDPTTDPDPTTENSVVSKEWVKTEIGTN